MTNETKETKILVKENSVSLISMFPWQKKTNPKKSSTKTLNTTDKQSYSQE